MKKFIFLLFLIPFIFCFSTAEAQNYKPGQKYWYKRVVPKRATNGHGWVWTKRREYISAGLNISSISYFGDIVPRPDFLSTDLRFTRPSIGIFVQKRFRPQFTGRFAFRWGRILSADSSTADKMDGDAVFRYIRNAHFRNDIFEISAIGQIDLMSAHKLNTEYFRRPKQFIPYIVGGFAAFYHNPMARAPEPIPGDVADWDVGEWVPLQPLGTEGQGRTTLAGDPIGDKYSRLQVAFPLGMGVRKRISDRIDIEFEFSYRFLLTDYLDDVSTMFQDLSIFGSNTGEDALARAFHDRSREGDRAVRLRELYSAGEMAYLPDDYTTPTGYRRFVGFGNDAFPDNIRGNSRDNDVYLLMGFRLIYIFPPQQVRCPVHFR
ncbi:MAG: hypothetical protein JJT94_03850 [Bernardetiaceae bacterium]|nr:hypothetical protein [Bernardetiaceae bacterium]